MAPSAPLAHLMSALILPLLLTGCSGATDGSSSTAEGTSSPTGPSLPPGAQDMWNLGLTGNMVDDLAEYNSDVYRLDGRNDTLTATEWSSFLVERICVDDSELLSSDSSTLKVQIDSMVNISQFDGVGVSKVITSYACPDMAEEVEEAIEDAEDAKTAE